MGVHDLAARGFEAAAEIYEQARPGYPRAAADLLVEVLGARPDSTIVDIGAGTGKLTRMLVATGARTIAVEPLDAMRRQLAKAAPGAEVLAGTAEALPLPDGCAAAVVVAQAFHWFRGDEALAEAARVLRPGGRLGLVWNRRDEAHSSWARLSRIIDPYMDGLPRYRSGRWREAFERTALFRPFQHRVFANEVEVGADDEVSLVASTSGIAALDESSRRQVLDRVRRELDGEPPRFRVPWFTDVYWCSAL